MTPARRSAKPAPLVLLAGWLFADLLLGLTIIMLGAQAPPPVPAKPAAGKSSPSPSPSPCSSRAAGVAAKPTKLSFRVNPGSSEPQLLGQVKRELRKHRKRLAGRNAGMVLTFGADGGAGDGVHLATRVNAAARKALPRVFERAATRNFHDLSAPSGSVSMEVYFVSGGCAPAKKSA
ncbi:hypothetical protein FDA94_16990 [Herbidospora galbida]|uniref:Uncharacterized protein n=1 Tax=Herbidospora galbida TaxID=2575442 RepID=A0A4V5V127_9ACTN|nr:MULTISPECIES: hypothetical protein [Herbidospora]TKK87523.1 hypothetical protein FDA94_16990 [Herbidospora galbida]